MKEYISSLFIPRDSESKFNRVQPQLSDKPKQPQEINFFLLCCLLKMSMKK